MVDSVGIEPGTFQRRHKLRSRGLPTPGHWLRGTPLKTRR